MAITITLLPGNVKLKAGSLTEDQASLIQVHNLNAEEIEKWLNNYKVALETLAANASTTSGSTSTITRNEIHIPVNLTDGQEVIDTNGFKVRRLGPAAGGNANSVEFIITDTNSVRNTIFTQAIGLGARTYNGRKVYPTMIQNLTNLRIVFAHDSEISPTPAHATAATDPNIKIISFI